MLSSLLQWEIVHSEHEENEVTLTLQDPTGCAIVTIVGNVGDLEAKDILSSEFDGPLLIQSHLAFAVVNVEGEEMIKATVYLAQTKMKHMHEVLLKSFNSRLQNVPKSHFVFEDPFLSWTDGLLSWICFT